MSALIAILAAGKGSRLGGKKLDRLCAGQMLGCWASDAALAANAGPVLILTPPDIPEFAVSHGAASNIDSAIVKQAELGLSHTVRAAFAHAEERRLPLVLLAADMPLIRSQTIRLLAKQAMEGRHAAAQYPDGRYGIPAAFPMPFPQAIGTLSGDRGAGRLIASLPQVKAIKLHPEELLDVDDPPSFDRVRAILLSRRSDARS